MPLVVLLLVEIVRVDWPEVLTDDGLKVGVAPLGNPLKLNLTIPVKPPEGVTVTEYVVLLPRLTVLELGLAASEKFAGVATTRVAPTVCRVEPLVPVMVSAAVPVGVLPAVVMVRVEEPEPETEGGLNRPLAPLGNPLTASVTVPLKPPTGVTMTV